MPPKNAGYTIQQAPSNSIGWTHFDWYWDDISKHTLCSKLEEQGIPHARHKIPHIIGMAGCAELVCYVSPRTSKDVTVLVVPRRVDIDSFAEEYYFFEGMTQDQALESEQAWIERYDVCNTLHNPRTNEGEED